MRSIHPKRYDVFHESRMEQMAAGRYNPALKLRFRDKYGQHTHTIGAGSRDELHVFREGPYTYLLVLNYALGYVGLTVYQGDDELGDLFLQYDWQVEEVLGKKGLQLSEMSIVKRMEQHLIEREAI